MAYCNITDLLLGDILIAGGDTTKQQYVSSAADEMDSKLGWLYVTPIVTDGDALAEPVVPPLPRHEALLLKGINAKLASGRLILTVDAAGEQTTLHAYGHYLIKQATEELLLIANGDLDLTAPRTPPPVGGIDPMDRAPGVIQLDPESLLSGFVNTVHGAKPWYVVPGGGGSDG